MPADTITVVLLATIAALASVAGGMISLWRKPTVLFMSLALGFASGVLIATVTFGMIPDALEIGSLPIAAVGFTAGFSTIYAFDLLVRDGS